MVQISPVAWRLFQTPKTPLKTPDETDIPGLCVPEASIDFCIKVLYLKSKSCVNVFAVISLPCRVVGRDLY